MGERTKHSKITPPRSSAVPSIGLDIVDIERVAAAARRNRRFLERVFTDEEIRYCGSKKNKWQHFAVRFAAKEAVWKAMGLAGLGLKDISIRNAPDGRPLAVLKGRLAPHVQLSLSHGENHALAVALHFPAPPRS